MNGDGQFAPVCVLYCTCTCQFLTVVGGWGRWVIIWFWQQLLARCRPMLPYTTACTAGSRRAFIWCMDVPWSIGFAYMPLPAPRRAARAVSLFQMTVFLVFHLFPSWEAGSGFYLLASWPEWYTVYHNNVMPCSCLLCIGVPAHVYEGLEWVWLRWPEDQFDGVRIFTVTQVSNSFLGGT